MNMAEYMVLLSTCIIAFWSVLAVPLLSMPNAKWILGLSTVMVLLLDIIFTDDWPLNGFRVLFMLNIALLNVVYFYYRNPKLGEAKDSLLVKNR